MKLLQVLTLAGFIAAGSTALGEDKPCPSLQLMQVDWQGTEKEAGAAATKALAAAGFKVTSGAGTYVTGHLEKPDVAGFIYTYPKTPTTANVAIVCVATEPMDAMERAQSLRSQMGKIPSPGRTVPASFTGIWVQQGGDGAPKAVPWTHSLSFTWHGPPDAAGYAAERGLHEMGFQQINGGGINPAHSGIKPREQITAVVTYAPLNEATARVHVLMAGYGSQARTTNYCQDLKSLIEYDLAVNPADKAPSGLTLPKAVDEVVNKMMKEGRIPGMAVAVLRNHTVAYTGCYGYAQGFDPDHTAPPPAVKQAAVTPATIFRWGSVIKTVTAVTALHLMEQGKLNIEDPVQNYVGAFPTKLLPGTTTNEQATITPHLLLCHESGIPHYHDAAFLKQDAGVKVNHDSSDPLDSLTAFKDCTLMFAPGSQMHYSSYGYMLLSAAVEQAGGDSFVNLVHNTCALPLKMMTLAVDRSSGAAVTGHAEGYTRDGNGKVIVQHAGDVAWRTGAGAYASNIQDLSTWANALLLKKILKPTTYGLAWKHQKLTTGKTTGLGLGFFLGKDGSGQLTVSHNGLADIATCQMTLYPEAAEGVVIMCNCVPGNGYGGPNLGALADQIREAAHNAAVQ